MRYLRNKFETQVGEWDTLEEGVGHEEGAGHEEGVGHEGAEAEKIRCKVRCLKSLKV